MIILSCMISSCKGLISFLHDNFPVNAVSIIMQRPHLAFACNSHIQASMLNFSFQCTCSLLWYCISICYSVFCLLYILYSHCICCWCLLCLNFQYLLSLYRYVSFVIIIITVICNMICACKLLFFLFNDPYMYVLSILMTSTHYFNPNIVDISKCVFNIVIQVICLFCICCVKILTIKNKKL